MLLYLIFDLRVLVRMPFDHNFFAGSASRRSSLVTNSSTFGVRKIPTPTIFIKFCKICYIMKLKVFILSKLFQALFPPTSLPSFIFFSLFIRLFLLTIQHLPKDLNCQISKALIKKNINMWGKRSLDMT